MSEGDAGNKGNTDGNWYDSLPADVHEHVKGFDSAEALAKGFIETKGKIPVIPENKDSYEHKPEEGTTLEEAEQKEFDTMVNQVKGYAESIGMTQDQFTKAVVLQQRIAGERKAKVQKFIQEQVDSLKKEWGADFEANMKKADDLVGKIFPDEFKDFLKKSRLDHNADFVRGVFNLTKLVSEDAIIKSGGGEPEKDKNIGEDGIRRDPNTGLPMLKYNKPKE
jgi:hypothetical protein